MCLGRHTQNLLPVLPNSSDGEAGCFEQAGDGGWASCKVHHSTEATNAGEVVSASAEDGLEVPLPQPRSSFRWATGATLSNR